MDELEQARLIIRETGKCTAGLFRNRLGISYARAVELQDELTEENETLISVNEPVSQNELQRSDLQVLPASGSGRNSDVVQERRVLPMSNGHAFLPPSGASSWSKCSLWPTMNAKFPQTESSEAIEGTAAHWVAWEILAQRAMDRGAKAPNGTIVTDEMIEGGELLANAVMQRAAGLPLYIEQWLPVHSISPHCAGTPDLWAVTPDLLRLEIFDYKFGHRFVDEFWNEQGLAYLAGILDYISAQFKIGPAMLEQMEVSFTVVQPRCYYRGEPVRTHTYRVSETRERLNHLGNMAESALMSEPTATTNDHCNDCPGRHACSALQRAAYDAAEFSDRRTPLELEPAAGALELVILERAMKRLEARVEGLREYVSAAIRAGKPVPYYRIEPAYGRTQWTIPDAQIVTIGKMLGHDLSKSATVTPTQAEKIGVDPNVVKAYSFRPSTAHKLIATNPTDAARVFGR